jgi:hypothetical protein
VASYEHYKEMDRYTAELKQLLAGSDLSPDTRARSLAALIETDALSDAAGKIDMAAQTIRDDVMGLLLSAARSFGENAQALALALHGFEDPANLLASRLGRLPDY